MNTMMLATILIGSTINASWSVGITAFDGQGNQISDDLFLSFFDVFQGDTQAECIDRMCTYTHGIYEPTFDLVGESRTTDLLGLDTKMSLSLNSPNSHFKWDGPTTWELKPLSDYTHFLEIVSQTGNWAWTGDEIPLNVKLEDAEKTIDFSVNLPGINWETASNYFIFNQIQLSPDDPITSGLIIQFDGYGATIFDNPNLKIQAQVVQTIEIIPEPKILFNLLTVGTALCLFRRKRKINKPLS